MRRVCRGVLALHRDSSSARGREHVQQVSQRSGFLRRTLTKVLGFPVIEPRALGGYFRNDTEHRDFVLIGTAAGLASAFSTPIGGLLLAIEQVRSMHFELLSLGHREGWEHT